MKKILILSILGVAVMCLMFSCKLKTGGTGETGVIEAAAPNTITQAEIDEGWVLLFDGTTSTGGRGYNKTAFPDTGWVIEDGTLHCLETGTGEAGLGGDIIYDKKFKNFRLQMEWKIGTGGNSGVFYLAQEIPGWQIWKTAPEMQI